MFFINKIVAQEQQVIIDEVSNEIESTKFNVSLLSSTNAQDQEDKVNTRKATTTTRNITRTIEELFEKDSLEEFETVRYITNSESSRRQTSEDAKLRPNLEQRLQSLTQAAGKVSFRENKR